MGVESQSGVCAACLAWLSVAGARTGVGAVGCAAGSAQAEAPRQALSGIRRNRRHEPTFVNETAFLWHTL